MVGVATLDEDLSALLADGPATVSQLAMAAGRRREEVERALVRMFSQMMVRPVGEEWHILAEIPVAFRRATR
ncbi:MAG: hypothetical protein ACYDDF_07970 [Thermoplasmatota archaeon]